MRRICYLLLAPALIVPAVQSSTTAPSEWHQSTRVVTPDQHACTGKGGYPYREKSDYVLRELDLRAGDVVVDIGAGDGWWAERMAALVGPRGTIHASEVDQKLVDKMEDKFIDVPQIKPYLCKTDSTGLPENSCDLAFLSKTYHHLNPDSHVAYLGHLRKVVKPTGRVCIIEKYPAITGERKEHAWPLSLLIQEAEEAGWVPVRYELMPGTYHYIAIFVQKDLFPAEAPQTRPATSTRD
jgi:ubiquinone/menaquinone biosynthesis C-methylase UbiE